MSSLPCSTQSFLLLTIALYFIFALSKKSQPDIETYIDPSHVVNNSTYLGVYETIFSKMSSKSIDVTEIPRSGKSGLYEEITYDEEKIIKDGLLEKIRKHIFDTNTNVFEVKTKGLVIYPEDLKILDFVGTKITSATTENSILVRFVFTLYNKSRDLSISAAGNVIIYKVDGIVNSHGIDIVDLFSTSSTTDLLYPGMKSIKIGAKDDSWSKYNKQIKEDEITYGDISLPTVLEDILSRMQKENVLNSEAKIQNDLSQVTSIFTEANFENMDKPSDPFTKSKRKL